MRLTTYPQLAPQIAGGAQLRRLPGAIPGQLKPRTVAVHISEDDIVGGQAHLKRHFTVERQPAL